MKSWAAKGSRPEQFYGQLFDWNINSNNEYNYGVVDTKTTGGIPGGVGPGEHTGSRVTIYVQVSDINETLENAKKLGAEVMMERTELPGTVIMALFKDPAGNVVGLTEEGGGPAQ